LEEPVNGPNKEFNAETFHYNVPNFASIQNKFLPAYLNYYDD